jgi:two-component system, OmpR family, sensor histidine kinase ChvG
MIVLTKLKRFMASAINTAKPKPQLTKASSAKVPHERGWWIWRRRGGPLHRRLSPLMKKIMAVNMMALVILAGSLLYMGRYHDRLIASELEALKLEAALTASALGEGAIVLDEDERNILSPLLARQMVRRLVEATDTRTRLFDSDENLLADSRMLTALGRKIVMKEVKPTAPHKSWSKKVEDLSSSFLYILPGRRQFPVYEEAALQKADQYQIVQKALAGEMGSQVWNTDDGGLLLAVATPVQRYKQILGAVMLSRSGDDVEKAIAAVRLDIIRIFLVALAITFLLSLYLTRAIARPIRVLAAAAEGVRAGEMQMTGLRGTAHVLAQKEIPDLSARDDEIGDLSVALRAMNAALAARVAAIENFAADVSHEIKNPLTSLRSAIETAEKVTDPVRQQKLMDIIKHDVDRLDRLITDISTSSRLDAELGRAAAEPLNLLTILQSLVAAYHAMQENGKITVRVTLISALDEILIVGLALRLAQVFQNLIDNAISFSPMGGKVLVEVQQQGHKAVVTVTDEGPGIPPNKLSAIFDRFYTERPKGEKFGSHSGLGLSITKQIIDAHQGAIFASNRVNEDGQVCGAILTVEIPLRPF